MPNSGKQKSPGSRLCRNHRNDIANRRPQRSHTVWNWSDCGFRTTKSSGHLTSTKVAWDARANGRDRSFRAWRHAGIRKMFRSEVLILRAPPDSAPDARTCDCDRGGNSDHCLRSDTTLAPPKVVAVRSGRAGTSDIGKFPGAFALLDTCGLTRHNACIVDPRNTLLPQCKIVRDKVRTEKHQVLSDRPKNYFRYSRAYRRTVSRLFG